MFFNISFHNILDIFSSIFFIQTAYSSTSFRGKICLSVPHADFRVVQHTDPNATTLLKPPVLAQHIQYAFLCVRPFAIDWCIFATLTQRSLIIDYLSSRPYRQDCSRLALFEERTAEMRRLLISFRVKI